MTVTACSIVRRRRRSFPTTGCFAVCRRDPRRLLPCVSINPKRRDALAELERCRRTRRARAVRCIRRSGLRSSGPRFLPFWERVAALGLVLVVHTGSENAAAITKCESLRSGAARERAARRLHSGCGACRVRLSRSSTGSTSFPSLQRMMTHGTNNSLRHRGARVDVPLAQPAPIARG
ncbi:MAG: amidohydrolase family protein [Planctomycetes bacterium]|nr:amidohydrolase family protein [Planctomycetota bacterium]